MDRRSFTNPAGHIVRMAQGYDAFLPNALPRELTLTPKLALLLSNADRALGELAGMARTLPNPELLIAPLSRREAVLSSRIEGTQASLSDLAIFEAAGEAAPKSHGDVLEVRNYRLALTYGIERLEGLPLSLRFVRELHARLLQGVRGEDKTPGEFRISQNWIGPPGCLLREATFVPPPPSELMNCLSDWEAFLHEDLDIPPLVCCAMLHYQFEAIHPFLDGNGRVGRLLILLYLVAGGFLSTPVLYLSPFFERYRDEYYSRLRAVTERSDWEGWIEFFLRSVVAQSEDAFSRSRGMRELQEDYRSRLVTMRAPNSALRLAEDLFVSPATTIGFAASRLGINWMTARAAIGFLVGAGILQEITGQRRDRIYVAEEIIDVTERVLETG